MHSTLVDYVSPRSAEPVVLLHKEKDLQQIQASASGWCPLGASQAPALSPSEQAVPAARPMRKAHSGRKRGGDVTHVGQGLRALPYCCCFCLDAKRALAQRLWKARRQASLGGARSKDLLGEPGKRSNWIALRRG